MIPGTPPPGPKTVARLIRDGAEILPRRRGIAEPTREASWLLAAALGVTETWLKIHPESTIGADVENLFRSWVGRRAAGEPAEHILGACRFWGRDFFVSPEVLIPRPETEYMIEAVLNLPETRRVRVLDVGTGSGCIAITLAAERPRWAVAGIDISLSAIRTARKNSAAHGTDISWVCGDLGSCLNGKFDVVTANLPYLPTDWIDRLPVEVRHEPLLALDGGADGLDPVRHLLGDLQRLLATGGWCLLELAEGQAEVLEAEARALGFTNTGRIRDAGGCERHVVLHNDG